MHMTDEQIHKRRWLILFNLIMLTFMATLDMSIVNVALPTISNKLNVDMATVEWVVTIYLILISAMILTFGRLGDIIGKTRIYIIGIGIFTLGSLLCGISNSIQLLIASRAIQAIGAGCTMSNSFGIITSVFPPNERGRSLGINSTAVALGTMVGPALGGIITGKLFWNLIFLINIPIGIFTFIISTKILPRAKIEIKEKMDWTGAIIFGVLITLLFTALIFSQQVGFKDLRIIAALITAIVMFIIFLIYEKRIDMPLVHLELFNNSLFSISVLSGFITFVAISCSNIILPFYFQDVLKLSPETTGLFMMISPILLFVVSPTAGYISDKIGSEKITFAGLVLITMGLLLTATLTQSTSIVFAIIYIALVAVGNGLFQPPNNALVMSSAPKNKLGIAGSINSLVRNLGMILGITLSTSILYNRMSYKMGKPVFDIIVGAEDVFMYGMKYVYIVAGVICLMGTVATLYRMLYGKKFKV